jgi:hypothetical protein
MKNLILFFLAFALASCGKFSDGTSVWAEGAWLLFWLPFLGSFPFLYFAYRASKSGSTKIINKGTKDAKVVDGEGNVSIFSTGQFWFFAILQAAAWGIVIYQNSQA